MINIALIVPCVNNFKGFCELIHSIYDYEDLDRERLLSITPIIIPNWENNIGVSAGWNRGILQSYGDPVQYDALLISNDDIVIPNYSVRAMYDRLISKPEVLLVSGRNTKDRPGFNNTVKDLENFRSDEEGDSPDFSCFMITYDTIKKVGLFDEAFTPAYFEDNDYHHRIHCVGGITANLGLAPMYHKSSISRKLERKEAPLVSNKQFEHNRAYYQLKWGGGPGKESFRTPFGDSSKTVRDIKLVHNKELEGLRYA